MDANIYAGLFGLWIIDTLQAQQAVWRSARTPKRGASVGGRVLTGEDSSS
jgi:hypothetical protein